MILDELTLSKLNRLALIARQIRAGQVKGERRSTHRGSSLEFADYRNYVPGDDLRRVDWKIYGRLDRAFLKLFEEEEDLAVYILVDTSLSMDWGDGETNKSVYALKLAAALGVIALNAGDQLFFAPLSKSSTQIEPSFGPARGPNQIFPLLRYVESLSANGQVDLNTALRQFALSATRPGLLIIISDLYSQDSLTQTLTFAQARGHEVLLLHLLSPEEMDVSLSGDFCLVDVETGEKQEVTLDDRVRRKYQESLQAWLDDNRAVCQKRGVLYININTAQPWDSVTLSQLREIGALR